jgi:hypothetical protein
MPANVKTPSMIPTCRFDTESRKRSMLLEHPEYATLMVVSSNKPAIPFVIETTCHTYGEVCSAELPVAVIWAHHDRPQVALGLSLCLPSV